MGRPSHSAYAPLATDHDPPTAPTSPSQPRTLSHSSSNSKRTAPLDAALARWTHSISDKMARKKLERRRKRAARHTIDGRDRDQPVQVIESVFEPWTPGPYRQNSTGEMVEIGGAGGRLDKGKGKADDEGENVEWLTLDHGEPMTKEQFDALVHEVEVAIEKGVQLRLNAKGSSGSYFAKDPSGKTVAIFKPKDEEVSPINLRTPTSYVTHTLTLTSDFNLALAVRITKSEIHEMGSPCLPQPDHRKYCGPLLVPPRWRSRSFPCPQFTNHLSRPFAALRSRLSHPSAFILVRSSRFPARLPPRYLHRPPD